MRAINGRLPRIAVLGAGHVGPVIARLAAAAGYPTAIAASREPDQIALTAGVLAPGAQPMSARDAVRGADIVVLAIPLHRFGGIDPDMLAGKVVVDMMNYWPDVNGYLAAFDHNPASSSELVAGRLARSRVVKTLNHLGYHQLDEEARPAGDPERRALGVAGDDRAAVEAVAGLVDDIGFDPILLGGLSSGRILEPDGPVFGQPMSRADFEQSLAAVAA
jgi:hypothetical protein